MLGKIVVGDQDVKLYDPNAENLVERVSPKEVVIHRPKLEVGSEKNLTSHLKNPASHLSHRTSPKVGLLNCGAKRNILRNLRARGATVYELPWNFDPFPESNTPGVGSDPLGVSRKIKIDGLMISNGPGDPKMAKESIAIIKKALKAKIPTFGICLGNQLLALAAGGDTYKLKFGHRAQNQPTIEVGKERCYITTQNHGFAVDEKRMPDGFRRWFTNANDNTNEGIIHQKLPFFSVQFHPEASPGPTDTEFLFDYFLNKVKKRAA